MESFRVWMDKRPSSTLEDPDPFDDLPQVYRPPPPLRTTSTYDDDEAFNSVALNLLSRHHALDMTIEEILSSTLLKAQDRASFLEGLQHRRFRAATTTVSLVQEVDKVFGSELRRMVEAETTTLKRQNRDDLMTPRSLNGTAMLVSSGSGSSSCKQAKPKKIKSRRFFPDCDSNIFLRSRRIQNIDWKLVEAITQVQSLRLDGAASSDENVDYEPPRVGY